MTKRKYISEFGLSAESEWVFIVEHQNLDRFSNEIAGRASFHIYLICRRPRITIDPTRFAIDEEWICGVFRVQRGNTFADHAFRLRNLMERADLSLVSEYPYTQFALVDGNGD